MLHKAMRSIVGFLVLVFAFTISLAQEKRPNPQEPKSSSAKKPAATPAAAPADEDEDDDSDSADIPPFARGRIDPGTYLRLRGELVALKRGIPDLERDPQARGRAIRHMELQEQLIRTAQQRLAQASARNGVVPAILVPPAWTLLGPDPIPNGQTSPLEVPVSGRVLAIAVDPTDATGNTAYVGTAQGGLYRTLDGGATWTALMDSAQSLAIGAITIDPMDHTIVFVGTGEGNFCLDCFFGVGLYVITNANGVTPVLNGPFNSNGTSDVFTGRAITNILVNPANHDQILVSTASGFSGASGDVFSTLPPRGVYFSTNAITGPTPTFTLSAIQGVANRATTDMAMDPNNANLVVVNVFGNAVAGDGGIWITTGGNPWNGTATWAQKATKSAIGKLAVNRSGGTPATTFFATFDEATPCVNGFGGTLYKSVDLGLTWTEVVPARGFCRGQCFYDMAPAIKPDDVNTILLGGSSNSGTPGSCGGRVLMKSANGGTSFAASDSNLHADSHATIYAPGNVNVVYAGNDGGIFRSSDGGTTWNSLNNTGFFATQFESMSVHPTDPNFSIGGTQDNGTPLLMPDGVTWTRADFGDGGFSAIDQSSTSTTTVTLYHTYFNSTGRQIGFAQVTAAGATEGNWGFFGCGGAPNGISCSDNVLFYAPLALGLATTPNTLYFGSDRLYRATTPGGTAMAVVSQAPIVAGSPNVPLSAIGVSAKDDNVRIVGLANGQVFATTTGANPLTNVTGTIPAKYVARAMIDPNNKTTAYVALDGYFGNATGHVWKTTNLTGEPPAPTWTSASSGIPDVPVNAFAVDPFNTNYLYAGTDIGVYNSTDGGATWNPYGAAGTLPRVAVFDLNIQPTSHKVRIGTHGKGAWEVAAAANFVTTTAVSPSSSTPGLGNNVILTATIAKGTGVPVPTGMVTFLDGVTTLGTGNVNSSGMATFSTTSLALGPHNITASYGGDSLYAGSTSPVVVVTVISLLPSNTGGSANPISPLFGGSVTLSATVTGTGATPTGTVTFKEAANTLGSGTLNASAQATAQTSALAGGSHNITAAYSGDTVYAASTSTPFVVTVQDFTLGAPAPASQTVNAGQPTSYTIALTSVGGFPSNTGINFTCSLAAIATTCTANPNPQTTAGGTVTINLTTTVRNAMAPPQMRPRPWLPYVILLPTLALAWLLSRILPLSASQRRRAAFAAPLVAIALLLLFHAVGCGGGSHPPPPPTGTPAGTYQFTVTGTSGTASHPANLTLVVN